MDIFSKHASAALFPFYDSQQHSPSTRCIFEYGTWMRKWTVSVVELFLHNDNDDKKFNYILPCLSVLEQAQLTIESGVCCCHRRPMWFCFVVSYWVFDPHSTTEYDMARAHTYIIWPENLLQKKEKVKISKKK